MTGSVYKIPAGINPQNWDAPGFMNEFAKMLIVLGVVFLGTGIMVLVLGKFSGIGRLPGDIFIKKENFSFYFPITTSLLLSIILSLIFLFLNRR